MASQQTPAEATPPEQAISLARLLPPRERATIAAIVDDMALWRLAPPAGEPPYVAVNMVSTADGRATIAGRSGTISDAADRALFHGLRTAVDAVLIGAGTVRTERYGRLVRDPQARALRARRGLAEEPLACIVSGRLAFDEGIPLLAEPSSHVVMLTPSAASLPDAGARIDYVRAARAGHLDLAAALVRLRERFSVGSVLCEGGPHLCRQLLDAGLIDELFLTLAPKLAGGEAAGGEALRILAGMELPEPAELRLLGVLQGDSSLFLRYGVSARARVSRETTDSSSLAS